MGNPQGKFKKKILAIQSRSIFFIHYDDRTRVRSRIPACYCLFLINLNER